MRPIVDDTYYKDKAFEFDFIIHDVKTCANRDCVLLLTGLTGFRTYMQLPVNAWHVPSSNCIDEKQQANQHQRFSLLDDSRPFATTKLDV